MKKIVRGLVTKNTPVLELELLIITNVQIDATKIKLLVVSGMLLLNNKQSTHETKNNIMSGIGFEPTTFSFSG